MNANKIELMGINVAIALYVPWISLGAFGLPKDIFFVNFLAALGSLVAFSAIAYGTVKNRSYISTAVVIALALLAPYFLFSGKSPEALAETTLVVDRIFLGIALFGMAFMPWLYQEKTRAS